MFCYFWDCVNDLLLIAIDDQNQRGASQGLRAVTFSRVTKEGRRREIGVYPFPLDENSEPQTNVILAVGLLGGGGRFQLSPVFESEDTAYNVKTETIELVDAVSNLVDCEDMTWSIHHRKGLDNCVTLSGGLMDTTADTISLPDLGDIPGAQEPVKYVSRRHLGEIRPGAFGDIKRERPIVHVKVTANPPSADRTTAEGEAPAGSGAANDTHQIAMALDADPGPETLTFTVSQSKVGSEALDVISGKPRKVDASYDIKFDQSKKSEVVTLPSKLSDTGRGPDAPKVRVSPLGFLDRIVIESQDQVDYHVLLNDDVIPTIVRSEVLVLANYEKGGLVIDRGLFAQKLIAQQYVAAGLRNRPEWAPSKEVAELCQQNLSDKTIPLPTLCAYAWTVQSLSNVSTSNRGDDANLPDNFEDFRKHAAHFSLLALPEFSTAARRHLLPKNAKEREYDVWLSAVNERVLINMTSRAKDRPAEAAAAAGFWDKCPVPSVEARNNWLAAFKSDPWGLTHLLLSRKEALMAFKAMVIPSETWDISGFLSMLGDPEVLDLLQKYQRLKAFGAQITSGPPLVFEFDADPRKTPIDIRMIQKFDVEILDAHEKFEELVEEVQQTNMIFDPFAFNFQDPLHGFEAVTLGSRLCELSETLLQKQRQQGPFDDAPENPDLNRILRVLGAMANVENMECQKIAQQLGLEISQLSDLGSEPSGAAKERRLRDELHDAISARIDALSISRFASVQNYAAILRARLNGTPRGYSAEVY